MTFATALNNAWNFRRLSADGGTAEEWSLVDLPHSPFVADLDGRTHWFGECEYERLIELPSGAPAGRCALYLGAAMHSAVVMVDGTELGRHAGGYLPFEVELTQALRDEQKHTLTVRLDNRDNAEVPPGKPYDELDFCWYGGLYRTAELRCYPMQYITDVIEPDAIGGGGIFVRTLEANATSAKLNVTTHIRNVEARERNAQLQIEILRESVVVAMAVGAEITIAEKSSVSNELQVEVAAPRLWQPDAPSLYTARITLLSDEGKVLDVRVERFGIRRIAFSRSGGFTINGRRIRLRGTNRHQEFPLVGYAAPRAAQFRDARRLKEAGFDYVRLSHYPQAPEFLDACDELGLVVMDCVPGWQFIGGERFRAAVLDNARQMIRRDRNHPCVVLWELSLNETAMDDDFMARLHAIGHEEYPGDQMYTCGWIDRYDVFVHSRQHGQIHKWANGDKALVVAEYGDWEFYARNEGFDQKTGAGVYDLATNSRKFRRDGERGMMQQAQNHLMALNDTLSSPAVLDGQWAAFDYARGYDPIRAAVGVMDIFRLPRFSYHFYRSQRGAAELGANWTGGPVAFIASHWTPVSELRVVVFSNCDEIALSLNGRLIGRQGPQQSALTQYLPHPPFVFMLDRFEAGTLEAVGYIKNQPAAKHVAVTPGDFRRLSLYVDDVGIHAGPDDPDVLFVHALLADDRGALCVLEDSSISFVVEGAALIGPNQTQAEAGIASVVVRVPAGILAFKVTAFAPHYPEVQLACLHWTRPGSPLESGSASVGAPARLNISGDRNTRSESAK